MTKKRHHPLRWIIWGLAIAFYFYEYLIRVFPSVISDELIDFFHINTIGLGLISASYFYAYAPMQIPAGALMDRYGARKLLTIASLICGFSTFLFSITHHLWLADISRFFMGTGSAFGFIGMIYICSHWFSGKKLGLLIGVGNSLGMFGAVFGLAFLSYVFQMFRWEQILYFLGIIGIILGIIIFLIVRNEPKEIAHKEKKKKEKISIIENVKIVLSNTQTWVNATSALFYYMTTVGFAGMWAAPFFKAGHLLTSTQAGFCSSMIFFGWIVSGPFVGYFSDKLQNRKSFLLTLPILSLLLLTLLIYFPPFPFVVVALLMFLIGVGSSAQLLNYTLAIELNPEKTKGFAVAFTNFLAFITGAITQTFVGYLLHIYNNNYQIALAIFPLCFLLGFIFTFFIKEKRHISHITYQ